MAKRIEGVTEKLLICAKEEFISKGYVNASLNAIARKAGSTKGSIYTRYSSKQSLYLAIVKPVADKLCEMIEEGLSVFQNQPVLQQKEHIESSKMSDISGVVDFIYCHYDEFRILLTSGENSVAQEFIHTLVEMDINCMMQYINKTGNDAISSGRLSIELVHLLSSGFFSGFFEIVIHDMPKENAIKHIRSLSLFYRAGWQTILALD